MRTVVVHDGTITPGGAVRVVLEAARALDADLVVGFSGRATEWWRERAPKDVRVLRETEREGRFTAIRTARRMLGLDLREYDAVLTSGPAATFYQPYDDQTHVHYLHHPPLTALWYDDGLFDYLVTTLDRIEKRSLSGIAANSALTATRAHRQYGQPVDSVINPPVDVDEFDIAADRIPGQVVLVGRLEERKRPALAIDAMRDLPDCTLKVLGDGPLLTDLESEAPVNVEFMGFVDDATLQRTVAESEAGLFLAEREDFGVTPVEYLAAGTPVVGVNEPNTNRQVDADVGRLVDPTPAAVADGVQAVLNEEWDRDALRDRADRFRPERFREAISAFVRDRVSATKWSNSDTTGAETGAVSEP